MYALLRTALSPPEEIPAAGFAEGMERAVSLLASLPAAFCLSSGQAAEVFGMTAAFKKQMQEETFRETMEVEYLRLFVNDFPTAWASPYESFYREGRIMGQAAQDCLTLYRAQGLALSEGADLADHIVTQLEYLHFLCLMETQALEKGDHALCRDLRSKQREFYRDHLMHWVPKFCDRITEHSRVEFYRVMSRLLKNFVMMENRSLQAEELDQLEEEGDYEAKRA